MYMLSFLNALDDNHPFFLEPRKVWYKSTTAEENEYISPGLDMINEGPSSCDFGNAVVLACILAVNKIQRLSNGEKIDIEYAWRGALNNNPRKDPKTLEQFISSVKEWTLTDHNNIIHKFQKLTRDININHNHIIDSDYIDIKEIFIKDINNLIYVVDTSDFDNISCCGYEIDKLPEEYTNDCMRYAKNAIINVIKDTSNEIWNIIWGNQKNTYLEFDSPEKVSMQVASQPLTLNENSFTPIPNYTGNKAIMKHFMIGNNVVIYDPHVQQSFEKDLISLSKRLDKVDKELKLKEPSKFGFVEFISPLNFKAVRLDESSNYVNSSDTDNYISVWTDKATLYISKPSKVTA